MTDERADDPLAAGRMTLWEHLAELRSRIIKAAVAVGIGALIGWFLYPYVVNWLTEPFKETLPNDQIISTDLVGLFTLKIETSAYLGIILAMPVILWQLWRFVTPGLYPHERRYAVPFVVSSLLLFAFGAAIAYWTLPAAIGFLSDQAPANVSVMPSIESYVRLNVFMMLAFGAGFEFPVLLVALQLVGVLTPKRLLGWWRHAIVVIVIVAAVITPSGDPISMMALAVPMTVFYFGAIVIGILVLRARRRGPRKTRKAAKAAARAGGTPDDGDAGAPH